MRVAGWWIGVTGVLLLAGTARAATLEEVLGEAETGNLDLRLQVEQQIQASSQRWQTLATLLPKVAAGATWSVNQNKVVFGAGGLVTDGSADGVVVQPKTSWSGSGRISQPLVNVPGWAAVRAASQQAAASVEDTATVRRQVRAAIARSYYALAAARESVVVAEQSVGVSRRQVDLARAQVDAGLVDALALMQAELTVSQGERDVLAAKEAAAQAEQAFARLTGLPADTPVETPPPVVVPADVAEAARIAVESRSDVDAAELRVAAARTNRLARNFEWLPTLDGTFTETYQQITGFNPNHFQWQIGLNFSWTLFDGGLRIFRDQQLASQVRSAKLQVEKVERQAREDVALAYQRLARSQAAFDAVTQEVALAEASLARAEARVQAGRATWLDVERSRLALESARLGVVRERANRDVAAIDVLAALGRY